MRAQPSRLPVPDEVLLRRFGLVRAAGGAAYFVAVAVLFAILGREVWPLALGVPVLAVVTTAYYKRSHAYPRASVAVSLVADALVLAGGVAYLGGSGSGLVMLYGVVVVSAGILLGPVSAYSFTAFTIALGLAQLGLEQLGIEPALLHREALEERVPVLLISLGGLASIGYLSAIYASRLHELVALAGREAASVRERSRRRRSFAQRVSLDVRTPLARLDDVAAALAGGEEPLDRSDRLELAGRLRMAIAALDSEIGQLADVGVLDPSEVTLEPVVLSRLVDECLLTLSDRLAEHEVTVDVDDVKVLADRRALRRVIANLVENVADHTPAGTRASVTTISGSSHSVLVVADDGPGIDPSVAERLFKPPAQGRGAAASRARGSRAGGGRAEQTDGFRVGLPLVAELCGAMGARVRHEPTAPKGGARFLVSLRLAPAAVPSADDSERARVS